MRSASLIVSKRLGTRLLAPLVLLERTRGRKRLALAALYGLIVCVGVFFVWWSFSLSRLPDVGDPFDVESFGTVELSESDNAYTVYQRAGARLRRLPDEAYDDPAVDKCFIARDWRTAPDVVRDWVKSNGPALSLWLEGTRKPDAVEIQPRDGKLGSILPCMGFLRTFASLACFEATRRMSEGDYEGAATLFRAMLRSSRHAGRHGFVVQKSVGMAILQMVSFKIYELADDSALEPEILHELLDETIACEELTEPIAECMKVEYLALMHSLDDPAERMVMLSEVETRPQVDWVQHLPFSRPIMRFVKREPERSRRVLRLIFANWIKYADDPSASLILRPKSFSYYAVANSGDDLPVEQLTAWFDSTEFARLGVPFHDDDVRVVVRDRILLKQLQLRLAERLFERERGKPPNRLGDLVGPYLKRLPEGYSPSDLPTAPSPLAN